jgi:glycosidase
MIDTPDWVKDAVFYQIFPDRFAKSERVTKGRLFPWDGPPPDKGYQGGDLLGVVERLDYLQDLGINAIYLNPIFQSACNHRYHTHDFFQVDPMLGGNRALRELVTAAHKRNIRLVLDGVLNHASRGFFQFNDILEQGAASAYMDWFTVLDWPLHPYDGAKPANYVAWANIRDLPKFNTDNPQVREFLMQVGEFWLREFEIDGWRLDVAAEITTPGFWQEFRQRVRAVNPEAYIVAEIWREARRWLQGDMFDATMHYELTAAVIAFCAGERVSHALVKDRSYDPYPGIEAAEYGRAINRLLNLYDWQVTQVQLNSLDSHDTARLLSIARGDKDTLKLATLLQMTYPGAPCVYYGDEIALRGTYEYDERHHDRDARWTFPWQDQSQWDMEMLAYFQEVIALRHAYPALRRGTYHELYAAGDVYAFARQLGDEVLVTAVNVASQPHTVTIPLNGLVADGTTLKAVFGAENKFEVQDGRISLTLPARSGIVIRKP